MKACWKWLVGLLRALDEGNQVVCESKYWTVPKPPKGLPTG